VSTQLIGLFPVPFMRVERALGQSSIDPLLARAEAESLSTNAKSTRLSHSAMMAPKEDPLFDELARQLQPHIVQFGATLFGETLDWSIKEMWLNVLEPGGFQAMHSHANSFVSGVVYLTAVDPSAHTVFHKAMGNPEFVFSNVHPAARIGPYNGTRWVLPKVLPGDLALWPSYLLHEVPVNMGNRRVSIAFNALPSRLDSWGYAVNFAP
jgi:uncharacterized protein (TIGR02466 family)